MIALPSLLFVLGAALLGLPLAWLVNRAADYFAATSADDPPDADDQSDAGKHLDAGERPGAAEPDPTPRAIDLSHFPRLVRYRPWAVAAVLVAGAIALALAYGPEWRFVSGLFYATTFLLITVVDLERRVIPDEVVLIGGLAALAFSLVPAHPVPSFFALVGGAAGLIVFSLVYLIGYLVGRGALGQAGSPVGLGDLKLAALIGLITGFPAVLGAIFVGAFVAGLVMIGLLATGRVGRRTFVPYGPFLVLGAAWTYFFGLKGYFS